MYFILSLFGCYFSYFFFAFHLLDIAISNKALNNIIQSVTHNGRQLLLTVLLISIVLYVYSVTAFNFFRDSYVQEDDGSVNRRCHDMKTCFIFHVYEGIRAGGGIGDQIEAPGSDDRFFRMAFDISFFFFVIVILLAILQGGFINEIWKIC